MVSSFSQRETRLTFFVWTLFSLFIVDPMTFNNTKSSFVIFSFVFYEEKINGSRQIFPFLIEMPSLRHLVMAKFRLEVLTTDVWLRGGGGESTLSTYMTYRRWNQMKLVVNELNGPKFHPNHTKKKQEHLVVDINHLYFDTSNEGRLWLYL